MAGIKDDFAIHLVTNNHMAKNLLKAGVSIDVIVEITGLTQDEIKKL